MDSDALKTFLAIHRSGSFSAAADALSRSQPAISRRVALLEAELKLPLFERSGATVTLSDAGRVLLPHAERVLAALQDATGALAELRSGNGGPVSLALVGTLAGTNLTTTLKRFAREHPKVELSLRTATSTGVSDLVRAGDAAIGLRYWDDAARDLVCSPVAKEKLVVICAPRHRLGGKSVAKLADLKTEGWLAFPTAGARESLPTILSEFLARDVGSIAWSPVDSLTAQKRLVEAGYGIALLPESAVTEELATRTLATIAVRDLNARNPIVMVTRKGGYLSEATKRLAALLKTSWRVSSRSGSA
jgi:DNA-binding transcriptional LysR family regulator